MRIKTFKDPEKLKELLQLLDSSISYCAIADHFHCDRTSVMYHARKIGIMAGERAYIRMPIIETVRVAHIDPRHPILKKEKVNSGKVSYMDYAEAEKNRITKHITIGEFVF